MSRAAAWAKGFARQASADFDTWSKLQRDDAIPQCHKLLFLQMACEKLTKAYLCNAGADFTALQASHAYIAKNLPIILRQQIVFSGMKLKSAAWVVEHGKHIAQEIELLAPAVRRGGKRPDNGEYPWEDGVGKLRVPIDWQFSPSGLLLAPAGRTFLKLVHDAIQRLR